MHETLGGTLQFGETVQRYRCVQLILCNFSRNRSFNLGNRRILYLDCLVFFRERLSNQIAYLLL